MAKKVFSYAFLLGAVVLLISGGIFFGLQYRQTMDDAYETLRGEASYVESGVKIGGIEYLKSLDSTNRIMPLFISTTSPFSHTKTSLTVVSKSDISAILGPSASYMLTLSPFDTATHSESGLQ